MLQYSIEFPNPIEYPIGIKIFYKVFDIPNTEL